jgi:hypothetical protein
MKDYYITGAISVGAALLSYIIGYTETVAEAFTVSIGFTIPPILWEVIKIRKILEKKECGD